MSIIKLYNKSYNTDEPISLSIFLEDDKFPTELKYFKRLNYLKVRCKNKIQRIPDFLYDFSELSFLDLSFNNLSGSISSQFGKLRNLNTLILKSNNFLYFPNLNFPDIG